jgi:signal transduction histidine kinase
MGSKRSRKTISEEKAQIALQIHDEIGQPLTAAKLIIERLRLSSKNSEPLLDEVRALVSEAQTKAARLCVELQPENDK